MENRINEDVQYIRVKYIMQLYNHISTTVHRYGITAINVLKRNFRNYKIVLGGLSHVLVMILDLRRF
jgi:hypothetical protein